MPVAPDVLKRERARARELRQSQWWKRRIERGVCHYCGRHVGRGALTMDHVVPLGRGGKSVRGNCVPACKACNTQKQRLVPVEWAQYLSALGARRDEDG
jgi:5-methylcytosine-specific restriction endonuclease McrA